MLKFCSCKACKYGRKRFGNPVMIKQLKRKFRHRIKTKLKKDPIDTLDDLPITISVPYTD